MFLAGRFACFIFLFPFTLECFHQLSTMVLIGRNSGVNGAQLGRISGASRAQVNSYARVVTLTFRGYWQEHQY
jgi:hypothetical protein